MSWYWANARSWIHSFRFWFLTFSLCFLLFILSVFSVSVFYFTSAPLSMFLHLLLSLYSHHSALFTKQTLFASVVVSSVKGWVHTYHIAVFISSRINCRFNVWNTVIRRLEKSCHCCFISSPLFYHLVLANIWGINEGPWFVRRKKQKAGQFLLVYLKKRSRESQPKSIFTSQHRILNTGNVLVISKCGPRACFMPSLRRCLWAECWIIDETRSWIKRQVCLCLCLSVCTSFSLCECVCVCGR